MDIHWRKIIVDTNILLATLIEKEKFKVDEWNKFIEHLKSLHSSNDFYITDIIEYEYKKNLIQYQKSKRPDDHLRQEQDRVLWIYSDEDRILQMPYSSLVDNLLDFDKKIDYIDIKYQDKLILMTGSLYFANDFLILTADRSDFITKVPEWARKYLYYYTILDKNCKPRTYYLIEYSL